MAEIADSHDDLQLGELHVDLDLGVFTPDRAMNHGVRRRFGDRE
jgi:hypothetical protein